MKNKTLAAAAYVFFIPSLYIVLTGRRKSEFVGFHGGQALVLWVFIFFFFFLARFLVNLAWLFFYIPHLEWVEALAGLGGWMYAVYCGLRAYREV